MLATGAAQVVCDGKFCILRTAEPGPLADAMTSIWAQQYFELHKEEDEGSPSPEAGDGGGDAGGVAGEEASEAPAGDAAAADGAGGDEGAVEAEQAGGDEHEESKGVEDTAGGDGDGAGVAAEAGAEASIEDAIETFGLAGAPDAAGDQDGASYDGGDAD